MNLVPINEIFDIEYGNQFDLNKLKVGTPVEDIAFVSRTSKNNGVSAWVKSFQDTAPYPSDLITVSLGGTYLLSAFVQQFPFYTAQNIKVLSPKESMDLKTKLFYCAAIAHNRFRYTSHGREANKTFDNILVPCISDAEDLSKDIKLPSAPEKFDATSSKTAFDLEKAINYVPLHEVFDVVYGVNLNQREMQVGTREEGVRFVSRTSENNGVSEYVVEQSDIPKNPANTLSVSGGGSVLEVFYQDQPYYSGRDLYYLKPKKDMTAKELLFYATIIKANRYRYSYGRQANKTLKTLVIPVFESSYIESYMNSVPFAHTIT